MNKKTKVLMEMKYLTFFIFVLKRLCWLILLLIPLWIVSVLYFRKGNRRVKMDVGSLLT